MLFNRTRGFAVVACVLAATLATACGTTRKEQIIVDATPSDVFDAVGTAIESAGYRVVNRDPEKRTITAERGLGDATSSSPSSAQTVTVVVEDWEESTVLTVSWAPSGRSSDEVKADQRALVDALEAALPDATIR